MEKTVLITGASSGIGLATANLFEEHGWKVFATSRNPERIVKAIYPAGSERKRNMEFIKLDVTDQASIKMVIRKVKALDVLVNNAGYALMGPFELYSMEQVRRQFETNVFGLMNLTHELLPLFRARGKGTIVNVASMGGRTSFPLYSVYNASKWAVEGFSEGLAYELEQFGIGVKIIEPGVINTDFYGRSMERVPSEKSEYAEFSERVETNMKNSGGSLDAKKVAEAIYKAANDKGPRLRYAVGEDAHRLSLLRKILPEWMFLRVFKSMILK